MTFAKTMIAAAVLLSSSALTPVLADSDVSHNWSSESEVAALRIFRDKYVELGGEWKETAFPDTEASVSSVKTRIIGGKPPMALQSALGGVMQEFAGAGMLQDISAIADDEDWAGRLSDGMDAVGQYDGKWVAAPVFVDVINWMYTNNDVLADAGVEAPSTWDEFLASLQVLADAGYVPLAVGGETWQEGILFDHVLLAVGGVELYGGVMTGDADVIASDKLRMAIEEYGKLRAFTDEGKAGRSWNDTNTLILSGKAGYFFMGPWAAGGYADMGPEGEMWSCRLTPWSSGLTIVTDGFQFIKVDDDADIEAQKLFAQAVMDPQTQIAAAKAKGTLPAVKGANVSEFDPCPSKAVEAMQTQPVVTHWNGHAADIGNAIKDTMSAFWNEAIDAEAAHQQLIDKLG